MMNSRTLMVRPSASSSYTTKWTCASDQRPFGESLTFIDVGNGWSWSTTMRFAVPPPGPLKWTIALILSTWSWSRLAGRSQETTMWSPCRTFFAPSSFGGRSPTLRLYRLPGYEVTSPEVVCAVTVYQAPGGSRTSARTVLPSTSYVDVVVSVY